MATGWNASAQVGGATVSGTGNTVATFTGTTNLKSNTSHTSGLWYFEITFQGTPDTGNTDCPQIGIADANYNLYNAVGQGNPSDAVGWWGGDQQEIWFDNYWAQPNGNTAAVVANGDVISFCVDLNNNRFYALSPEYIASYGAAAASSERSFC